MTSSIASERETPVTGITAMPISFQFTLRCFRADSIGTMARRIFETIGRSDMNDDARFRTNSDRVKHRALVDEALGAWFATKTRDEALQAMRQAGATVGPVYDIADAVATVLINDLGIDASRVSTEGFGESRPIATIVSPTSSAGPSI
jgi:crotonobetainyl-CoA:carnitine CoA-transferase CaiB-like acyl-CoA transferase